MKYDCNIVANNNIDFVIAKNISDGKCPILLGAGNDKEKISFVSEMNFDIADCCRNNGIFRMRYKKALAELQEKTSTKDKFNVIQNFIESTMPLCEKQNLDERNDCIFDREPLSYMIEHKLCMCSERAAVAQHLCQESGINSYMVNSYVRKDGKEGQHAYLMFEENNHMFVYDPANPTKNNAPRIMDARMDKAMFNDFINAVNENADSSNKNSKNCVGFACKHEDGKIFLYRSFCGNENNKVTPLSLQKARAAKQSSFSEKSR